MSGVRSRLSEVHRRNVAILPTGITVRGLSRTEAAALTGLSPTAYDKARRDGKYPGPTLPGGKYDCKLIWKAMDRASGLEDNGSPIAPLDAWRKSRGSG